MEILLDITRKFNIGLKDIFRVFDSPQVEDMIERLNREQLLAGKNADGGDLMRYVDDPFFKTVEAALRYKEWKKGISPNKLKDDDIMDFYINGQFHESINAEFKKDGIDIFSTSNIEGSFERKTDGLGFGLNDISKIKLYEYVKPLIIERLWNSMK